MIFLVYRKSTAVSCAVSLKHLLLEFYCIGTKGTFPILETTQMGACNSCVLLRFFKVFSA